VGELLPTHPVRDIAGEKDGALLAGEERLARMEAELGQLREDVAQLRAELEAMRGSGS
jgi:hypothetical protein